MEDKLFTIEEARTLLPMVKKELESLQKLRKEIDEKYQQLQRAKSQTAEPGLMKMQEDPFFKWEAELDFLFFLAEEHINRISQTGAQLKDIEMGLLDFPSKMNGQVILLCWRQGEETISHWHATWEGYAGRKKVDEKI